MLMKKNKVLIVLITIMCLLVLTVGCGNSDTPASNPDTTASNSDGDVKPIDLKFITSWAKGNVNYLKAEAYASTINELSGGKLNIKIVGGTEAFGQNETVEAVSKGTMDGAYTAADYYIGYVPEASIQTVTMKTHAEAQANGGLAYLQETYKNHGLMLTTMDDMTSYLGFHIWTKKPIESLDDINGMKIRTSPGPLGDTMEGLGATVVTMPLGDVFAALEQGLIDGYTVPSYIGGTEGFFEYTAMRVDPPVFGGGACVVFNLDSFNKLPADLQEFLLATETSAKVNEAFTKVSQTIIDSNFKLFEEAGGQVLNLSDADKAKLEALTIELSSKYVEEKTPEHADKLKDLFL